MKNNLPFNENKLSNNEYIRTFSKNINENELKWHFDNEDRIIICNEDTNWFFQKDNRLPQRIIKNKPIYIKEGEYHRLIKGDNDLKLRIIKSNNDKTNK